MANRNSQQGFTLVEVAIVLLIVTILLGYTVAMFPVQQELKQYRQVEADMDNIVEHLIGFAQVNGRLPCPDTNADVNGTLVPGILDGLEDTDDLDDNVDTAAGPADGLPDSCKSFYGFLPAGTLGLTGDIDPNNGRMLDPWGQPYRYHVLDGDRDADADAATFFGSDLVTPNGIRQEGLSNVAITNPGSLLGLQICDDSNNPFNNDTTCAAVGGNIIVTDAVVVVLSTGKDRGTVASNIQDENLDGFQDGQNDLVYTFSTRSDLANNEYDDVVRWISPNVLFTRMIQADQLP